MTCGTHMSSSSLSPPTNSAIGTANREWAVAWGVIGEELGAGEGSAAKGATGEILSCGSGLRGPLVRLGGGEEAGTAWRRPHREARRIGERPFREGNRQGGCVTGRHRRGSSAAAEEEARSASVERRCR